MMAPAPVPCYLSDSGTGQVDAFDFAGADGGLSARRTIVEITEPGLAPDGLTVDGVDVRGVPCLPFRGKPRE